MTEPAQYDSRRTPAIRWRGAEWPIPPLVADQLDAIWDDVIEVTEALRTSEKEAALADAIAENQAADGPRKAAESAVLGMRLAATIYALTGEQYKKLREIVYCGLTRAHPDMTREEFRSVSTTPFEMLAAFFVVRRQSQMYGPALEGDAAQGEAPAGETIASQTSS